MIASVLLALAEFGLAAQFHVSTTASPNGNGSMASPWQLQTALGHPVVVQAGDTIWIHGGTYTGAYTGNLTGTASKPIVVRNYNNERATLDGNSVANVIIINGGYTWYWGLEVTNSKANAGSTDDKSGITSGTAAGIKIINCIAHDNTGNGISAFMGWTNAEVSGCLSYYNGRTPNAGPNYAYGLYGQNQAPSTKDIRDNFFIHNYGNYPVHIYGSEAAYLDNFSFTGNVLEGGWFLIGGGNKAQNNTFSANYFYGTGGGIFDLGWQTQFGPGTSNAVVTGNYFMNGTVNFNSNNTNTSATSNTFYGGLSGGLTQNSYPNNTYYTGGSRPSGVQVFVRPNKYESGRANIVVYNWSGSSTATVDVSSALGAGDQYEVKDAQNYFGTPVASGTYSGSSISISLTGTNMPTPVSVPSGRSAPSHTSSEFGMFVLVRTSGTSSPSPSGTFAATPDTLAAPGGSITLSWTSQNATSASIDQGIGVVAVNGTTSAQVTATKTFTLTLSGAGGTKTYTKTVVVKAAVPGAPTGTFGAAPDTLAAPGGTVTLSWTSQNATSASIDQGVGVVALNGSRTVQVTVNKTFTLTLTGAGGTTNYARAVLVATALPASPSFVSPAPGSTNQPVSLTMRWTKLPGASAYHLQMSSDSLFRTMVVNDSSLIDTLRQIGTLSTGTTYYRHVRAKNGSGWGSYCATCNFATASNPAPAGLPLVLEGATPEEQTIQLNIVKPSNDVNVLLSLDALDPDSPNEGALYINEHSPLDLFGAAGLDQNDKKNVRIDISTPAAWWVNGVNTLRFVHLRTAGFRIENISVTYDALTSSESGHAIPAEYALSQNFPNPFNPSTTIEFSVPRYGRTTLKIYNELGAEVANLVTGDLAPGKYVTTWNATGLASGVYFYRLRSSNFSTMRKLLLVK